MIIYEYILSPEVSHIYNRIRILYSNEQNTLSSIPAHVTRMTDQLNSAILFFDIL